MSITEKLNKIKSCKEDIKQAIIDKGVDMTGVSLEGYATKISEIQAGGGSGDYLDIRANLSTYYSTTKSVGDFAFAYCSSLTSVNLPNCTFAGVGIFSNCQSLQYVNLPNCTYVGVGTFLNCKSLTSVNIPKISKTTVSMFQNCSSLQYVNLPNCTYVEDSFEYCTSLTSINIPNCISIGNYAFSCCSNLSSLDLPMCISIGTYVFANCSSLQSANLPQCVYIGGSAFISCSSLSVLDLRSIYSCVLSNSNAFSKTPFASGIGSIYVHAAHLSQFQNATNWTYFSNCLVGVGDPTRPLLSFDNGRVYGDTPALYSRWTSYLGITGSSVISIDLPNVETLSSSAAFTIFSNLTEVSMDKLISAPNYMCSNCQSLQYVNLPNCSYIGEYVFILCSSLQSVNIPMCESVGKGAFDRCSSLTTVNLPMCESVDGYAFNNCSSLQSVNLPMCETIGAWAFDRCPSLSTIYIGTSISTVCMNNNANIPSTITSIFVPMSLVDAYKSAQYWLNYASRIYGV